MMSRWLRGIMPLAASIFAGGVAHAKPVWREAFQSSPATYEAPSEAFLKFAAENWHIPRGKLLPELTREAVDGTVRYRITVQAAGNQVRVRLSNEEGTVPIRLSAASVGLAGEGFVAQAGSLRALTFASVAGVTSPPGTPMLSDPVSVPVRSGSELLVSVVLAGPMVNERRGGEGFAQAARSQAMQATFDRPTSMKGRPLVTGVSVLTETPPHIIVALGDSITDGNRESPNALHG